MNNLLQKIGELQKSQVKNLVDSRLKEFKQLGQKPSEEIYRELCFCTLTANYDAKKCIAVCEAVNKGFADLPEKQLEKLLRAEGYRYPNRAAYILESRKFSNAIKEIVYSFEKEAELRQWLAKNVKGLGMKEASHFLRNIGFQNLAIIDFHIVDLLAKHKLIKKPKTMTKKKYLEIEAVLQKIAAKQCMTLAELDLYLWYLETGKVLK